MKMHLLEAIQLPYKVAHNKGIDNMSVGNRKDDEIAKTVAQTPLKVLPSDTEKNKITSELLAELEDNAPKQERQH